MKKIDLFIVGKKTKVKLDTTENPTTTSFWVTFILLLLLGIYLSFPVLVTQKFSWTLVKLYFGLCIYTVACCNIGNGIFLLMKMKIKKEKTVEDELDLPKRKPL